MKLADVWAVSRGRGVRLAVLDTGVGDVPGLVGRVTWLRPDGTPDYGGDAFGHGTKCAVLAASDDAAVPGVAPECELVSIRVTDSTGEPAEDAVRRAFTSLAGQVDVISCSFVLTDVTDGLRDAVRAAAVAGAFIVGAAGNDSSKASAFPERMAHVFTVTALGRDGAPVTGCRQGSWIDVSAPGEALLTRTQLGGITSAFGKTSGAAALVSGAAVLALALAKGSLRQRLVPMLGSLIRDTARDLGAPGRDDSTGAGCLDLPRLLDAVSRQLALFKELT